MHIQPVKFNKELVKKSRYSKFNDFHNLMRFRIRDILLVSSLYDSYIFEEDGRLYELIRQEYQGLNLSHSPELIQVSSGKEAIKLALEERRFDLIITTLHVEDMSALSLAKNIKDAGIEIPVVLLGYDNREMMDLIATKDLSDFSKVFIWQGDYRIILGIIKYLEDKFNVEHDTHSVGVQSIIVVEDNIRFYSSYLPLVYMEVLKQSQSLISEGVNLTHKFLRMRARPKILLCATYEEAWEYFDKYEEYILGIISDIDFLHNGKSDSQAGLRFAQKVKERQPDVPVLLQSSLKQNESIANNIGADFLLKDSPTLLEELKKFMLQNFGFGDFIFKNKYGEEVGRAKNLLQLEEQLAVVPDETILYHASRNHFSNWLKARTEFWLAHQLRPKKVTDFHSVSGLRRLLIDYIHEFRKTRQIGVISDFSRETFDITTTFARMGGGSLGGKARGLGFINSLLSNFEIAGKFENVKIYVPPAVVVGTDIFDQYLDENKLRDFALRSADDKELTEKFLMANIFPEQFISDLTDFLELVREPIAVRSSSLLEDSQGQPFAGVYDTLMLPNNDDDLNVRLRHLLNAIKRIYLSIFINKSKDYIKVTSYRLEEEKMAVIIQKMVGAEHNNKYYPEIAGVAKSYNFYPNPPLKSSDGIVSVALGLGKTIVEGGLTIRFSPKYPHNLLQYSNFEEMFKYSPRKFFALDLSNDCYTDASDGSCLKEFDLLTAKEDGTLDSVGSTYSPDNDVIYDGVRRPGTPLFTLGPLLKYHLFPLPEILEVLLELGSWGTGAPVEMEFAVNLSVERGHPKEFALLQMRPLVISYEMEELELESFEKQNLLCKSSKVLGHGVFHNIRDIVFVDIDKFNRSASVEVAHEIAQFNSKLVSEEKPYLLIGMGRWGTMDPWLGIPVTWEQINGAKAIVESNFQDFNVAPSQGTHFFQNLTSFKVGYFTVDSFTEQGFIDWSWLKSQDVFEQKEYSSHIRLNGPVEIIINGQNNKGVIAKPAVE